MEKKSGLPAFITALIPGVGYMYLGLKRKGIEALVLFILIEPLLNLAGLNFLVDLIRLPLWFYTFFDTINLAGRIDKGEFIPDSDFLFLGSFLQNSKSSYDNYGESENYKTGSGFNSKGLGYLAGWTLVVIGGLSLINKVFKDSDIYNYIRHTASLYVVPVLLVLAGVYILMRNKKNDQ